MAVAHPMLKAASSPPLAAVPSASIQETRSRRLALAGGGVRPKLEVRFHSSQSKPAGVSQVIGKASSESAVSLPEKHRHAGRGALRQLNGRALAGQLRERAFLICSPAAAIAVL
jgi:hypothetical protein